MSISEHDEQAQAIAWARANADSYPPLRWLFAIPNGGHRHIRQAALLKEEGVLRGVSDLCLPFPNKLYHGLYIEVKRVNGRHSDIRKEQFEFMDWANGQGYLAVVCFGAEEIKTALLDYLK